MISIKCLFHTLFMNISHNIMHYNIKYCREFIVQAKNCLSLCPSLWFSILDSFPLHSQCIFWMLFVWQQNYLTKIKKIKVQWFWAHFMIIFRLCRKYNNLDILDRFFFILFNAKTIKSQHAPKWKCCSIRNFMSY